jgi:uncharacterized membrane protein
MSKKAVYAIATSLAQAEDILERLRIVGFSRDDVSVLLPDVTTSRDFGHEKGSKAPEGAVTGAGTGGILGGAVGLLAGIGALAIPGVGPLIAAGPIMAALSGIAVGAAVGGLAGALVGMGIPEYVAKRYAGKIEDGNILVSVHADDADSVKSAKEVLEAAGAQDISTADEESAVRAA